MVQLCSHQCCSVQNATAICITEYWTGEYWLQPELVRYMELYTYETTITVQYRAVPQSTSCR